MMSFRVARLECRGYSKNESIQTGKIAEMSTKIRILFNLTVVSTLLVLFSSSVEAGYRRYQASLDESNWAFKGNALQCQLAQKIPYFGEAKFMAVAGRPNMQFELKVARNRPLEFSTAKIDIQAPLWRPGITAKAEGEIEIIPDKTPLSLEHDKAWRLLSELEQGFDPAFRYEDWIDKQDTVVVALSSVRFYQTYRTFVDCVGKLLPFTFKDIETTTLNFDFDSTQFTRISRQRLLNVRHYLEADKSINLVLLAGHTDNQGKQGYNIQLSRKRALAVKKYLMASGIPPKRIHLRAYGEGRPIASNANPEGRAKNRRVLIRLVK